MYMQEQIDVWIEKYQPDEIEKQYTKTNKMRGALFAFGNLGVSIQWGGGSYSGNHDLHYSEWEEPSSSYTAEVAIWYKGRGLGHYLNPSRSPIRTATLLRLPNGDTVAGWSEPEDIEAMIEVCRDYARA